MRENVRGKSYDIIKMGKKEKEKGEERETERKIERNRMKEKRGVEKHSRRNNGR